MHTDHSAIKYLMTKKDAKPRLIIADHLSRLEGPSKEVQINDDFPNAQFLAIEDIKPMPWFADYVNYLVAKVLPPEFSY